MADISALNNCILLYLHCLLTVAVLANVKLPLCSSVESLDGWAVVPTFISIPHHSLFTWTLNVFTLIEWTYWTVYKLYDITNFVFGKCSKNEVWCRIYFLVFIFFFPLTTMNSRLVVFVGVSGALFYYYPSKNKMKGGKTRNWVKW